MSGLFDGVEDDGEDIFSSSSSAPPVPSTSPPPPLPVEKEETPSDLFSEQSSDAQMNLFSPGKENEVLEFDPLKPKTDLFGDDDDDAPEINEAIPSDIKSPLDDSYEDQEKSDALDDDFELIESFEAPPPEEAERQINEIQEEAERRRKEEEEEKEKEKEKEEEEEEQKDTLDETTDGAIFTKMSATRHDPKDDEEEPLTTASPPLSDDDKESSEAINKAHQDQINELTMKLQQTQSELAALKTQVGQLEDQLKEEREKSTKLEATIKERDNEIASLKAAAAGKPLRKTSSSARIGSSSSTSISSPRTGTKLDRKGTASVAETAKKFGGTRPSPPTKARISVNSKPDKPDKPVTLKESSTTKVSSSTSSAAAAKKERTTSQSSQEGVTQSVASSKREAAEKAAAARAAAAQEREKSRTQQEALSPKSSPSKPPRNRGLGSATSTAPAPESSPKMSSSKDSRSALDAIKMWEQKSTGGVSSPPSSTDSPKKKVLSEQLSAPMVSSSADTSTEVESTKEEEPSENVPPPKGEGEAKKEEEKKVTLRDKSIDKDTRGAFAQSCVVPGSSSGKKWGPVLEKCEFCKKTVYQLERLQADGKVFHKSCFRCTHCKKVVGLGTYAAIKGEIYCKTHFKMLFKIKGNYDEGFGRSQHKSKWINKSDGEQSSSDPSLVAATQ